MFWFAEWHWCCIYIIMTQVLYYSVTWSTILLMVITSVMEVYNIQVLSKLFKAWGNQSLMQHDFCLPGRNAEVPHLSKERHVKINWKNSYMLMAGDAINEWIKEALFMSSYIKEEAHRGWLAFDLRKSRILCSHVWPMKYTIRCKYIFFSDNIAIKYIRILGLLWIDYCIKKLYNWP